MKPLAIKPKSIPTQDKGALAQCVAPTKRRNVPKRVYHCNACLVGFDRYGKAKSHEQLCALRLRRLHICKYCLTLYGDEQLLARHLERKHADLQCLCLQCGKRYSSSAFLYRHVVSWHGERTLFYCAMCADNCNDAKTFSSMYELIGHAVDVHHLQAGEVENDDENETEDLEMLEENIEDILPIVDWDDDVTFGWPMDLVKESCIGDPKPSAYVCPFCADDFTGSLNLINHLQQVHQKNTLDCSYCGKAHGNREALRMHLQRVHVLIRGHICAVCQTDFASSDHLKKHMNSQHLQHRPHICTICGKGFAQLSHLNEHLMTDRGHSEFICELCGTQFFRSIDLQRHVNQMHG